MVKLKKWLSKAIINQNYMLPRLQCQKFISHYTDSPSLEINRSKQAFTNKELSSTIYSFNKNKAPGFDNLGPIIVKCHTGTSKL